MYRSLATLVALASSALFPIPGPSLVSPSGERRCTSTFTAEDHHLLACRSFSDPRSVLFTLEFDMRHRKLIRAAHDFDGDRVLDLDMRYIFDAQGRLAEAWQFRPEGVDHIVYVRDRWGNLIEEREDRGNDGILDMRAISTPSTEGSVEHIQWSNYDSQGVLLSRISLTYQDDQPQEAFLEVFGHHSFSHKNSSLGQLPLQHDPAGAYLLEEHPAHDSLPAHAIRYRLADGALQIMYGQQQADGTPLIINFFGPSAAQLEQLLAADNFGL